MPYTLPFNGNYSITSDYGKRILNGMSDFHDGIDFGCPTGTQILSIEEGKVVVAGKDQYGGLYIDILMIDGRKARYVHLSKIDVVVGQLILKGQYIGLSGNTGNSSGPHLHFGLWQNQYSLDPKQFLPLNNTHNNMTEITTPTWQKLRDIAGASHQEDVQRVYNAQEYDTLISYYADRCKDANEKAGRITELSSQVADLIAQNNDLKKQNGDLQGQLQIVQKEIEDLKNQPTTLSDVQPKIEDLTDKISQNTSQISNGLVSPELAKQGIKYFVTKVFDRLTSSRLWITLGFPAFIEFFGKDTFLTTATLLILGGFYIGTETILKMKNNK